MATEPPDGPSGYQPTESERILGEAADVLRTIGFAGTDITIFGGLAPSLLVPVIDPAYGQPHVGTRDVDLCLSLALIEHGAESYDRIETRLKAAGFVAGDVSFRWLHSSGTEIEFFCPAGPGRTPGRLYRPPSGPVRQTLGGRLTALSLAEGELLTADRREVRRRVSLPADGGVIDFLFPVTGPAGFLAAKVGALAERDKSKDAYDIVWLLEAYGGGPESVAAEVIGGVGQRHPREVSLMHDRLLAAFADPERHGSMAYARFMQGLGGGTEDFAAHSLRAVGAVDAYLTAMGSSGAGQG